MKNKSTELDVDFIGGQGPLTKKEEQAISEFIKAQKLLKAKKRIPKIRTTSRTRLLTESRGLSRKGKVVV
jgi:hypothetical protein